MNQQLEVEPLETVEQQLPPDLRIAELEKRVAFIIDIHSKYESVLLQQAESMSRLVAVVDRLATQTEKVLDIIEVVSGRSENSDERLVRAERVLERLVSGSDRQTEEIRSIMDSHRLADDRIRNLVSAMGTFIGQVSPPQAQ